MICLNRLCLVLFHLNDSMAELGISFYYTVLYDNYQPSGGKVEVRLQ